MDPLDRLFAALADETRRGILARLAEGEAPVGDLVARFDFAGPTITRHLDVLEQAGLVSRRKKGAQRLCRLEPDGLRRAADYLSTYQGFWSDALDRLERALAAPDGVATATAPPSPASPTDPGETHD